MNKQLCSEIRAEYLMSLRETFPKIPSWFPVFNLHTIVLHQLNKYSFLHIFLGSGNQNIGPVFFFSNKKHPTNVDGEGQTYKWANNHLILVSKRRIASIEEQVKQFDVFFKQEYRRQIIVNKVTIDLNTLVYPFKSLNGVGISIGVTNVSKDQFKFVVIFEVPIAQCKCFNNNIIGENRVAYFGFDT